MALWAQNLVVAIAIAACAALVLWQGVRALRGKPGALSGCGTCKSCRPAAPSNGNSGKAERIVFLPVEMLARRR